LSVLCAQRGGVHARGDFERVKAAHPSLDPQGDQGLDVAITIHPRQLDAMLDEKGGHLAIVGQHQLAKHLRREERSGFKAHVLPEHGKVDLDLV